VSLRGRRCHEGEAAIVSVGFSRSGEPSCELRALTWADVDLDTGLIHVVRSWDAREGPIEPKSRAGRRHVPFGGRLRRLLVEQHLHTGGVGLVFGRTSDFPFDPSTVASRSRRAWERAGLQPITMHEARHTCASLMIAAGLDAKTVSEYLGHSSITITFDRYGHLLPGSEREAREKLEAFLDASADPLPVVTREAE
jgi:integrase